MSKQKMSHFDANENGWALQCSWQHPDRSVLSSWFLGTNHHLISLRWLPLIHTRNVSRPQRCSTVRDKRGNVSAQPTTGTLSSPKGWEIKKKRRKKKNPAWNDVSDELSREKHAEGLVCKTKTLGEKGSFLHLWRKKRPFRMKTRSPTFDKRVCAGMNASVWRVIKLSWSIHHAVTVWMKPVKGQAVSRLLLPHKRRENKLSWEVTRQIRCNSHIRSLPPTCPCILHWAVKLKKKKMKRRRRTKGGDALYVWQHGKHRDKMFLFGFFCSITKVAIVNR